MHIIDDNAAYLIKCERVSAHGKRELWKVEFITSAGDVAKSATVAFSDLLVDSDVYRETPFKHEFYAARCLAHGQCEAQEPGIDYFVTSSNFATLSAGRAFSTEELDPLIFGKVKLFYECFPEEVLLFFDLAVSINTDPNIVFGRASFWGERGWLGRKVGQQAFSLDNLALDKIDKFFEEKTTPRNRQRYFKTVQLREEFNEPYVFILMPFDDNILTRDVFDNIIKPTVEACTGLKCYRADDYQNAEIAHDQIYSQIVKAEAIVADITTLNPNVLIEIGVAMTEGIKTYPLLDKNRFKGKIPFYIDRLIYHPYTGIGDLPRVIKSVVKI